MKYAEIFRQQAAADDDETSIMYRADNLLEKADAEIEQLQAVVAQNVRRAMAWEDRYNRDVLGLNNEGDPIGGDPPRGLKRMAQDYVEFRRLVHELVCSDLSDAQKVASLEEVFEGDHPDVACQGPT